MVSVTTETETKGILLLCLLQLEWFNASSAGGVRSSEPLINVGSFLVGFMNKSGVRRMI